jgi:hypothetical protein
VQLWKVKIFQPEGKKGVFWKARILEEGTSEVGGCSRGMACGNSRAWTNSLRVMPFEQRGAKESQR